MAVNSLRGPGRRTSPLIEAATAAIHRSARAGEPEPALTALGRLDDALAAAREAVAFCAQSDTAWSFLGPLARLAGKCGRTRDAALELGRAEIYALLHRALGGDELKHLWRRAPN